MDKTNEWFENQINGLILIMKDNEAPTVHRCYVVEKLNMILNSGIGFHPSIEEKLKNG